ncbi:DNA polymerase III subunit alpha [candidate division KSB1 bacterium]|nr:DNA polymerase III subunit alpha [candidate division KSB1 bacterium]
MGFVHLHVHSHFSLCRGASSIDALCAAAAQTGMTHLALTDRNGLYGLGWFLDSARSHGLHPLIGAELVSGRWSAVLLARNPIGYRVLCSLVRRLHFDPDMDLSAALLADGEQCVVLSRDPDLLRALAAAPRRFDLYAELVPHANREAIRRLAGELNLPVAATNAVYFCRPEEWSVHRLLRAIDLNTTLTRIPAGELVSPEAFLKSPQRMQNAFPDCSDAIRNTQKIAADCTFEFGFGSHIFTAYRTPDGRDAFAELRRQLRQGIRRRYGRMTAVIRERMQRELEIIEQKGFAPYFLVVADIVRKAPRTCGRGSAAASLVSYCLGITHVDPIRHDLFFERFLNPGRIDPPDIDVDFPWDERDEVLDYIRTTYGTQRSAMIANHNCFKARSAVREVAKVYGLPDSEIGTVTKKMTGYYQPDSIAGLIESHPIYKGVELTEPWPEILQLAETIRGFPRHLSVHCGGVVIAPDHLDHYVPVQPAKKVLQLNRDLAPADNHTVQVVQWEKDQAEEMGLIKIDILGNRSLAVIRDALAAVEQNSAIRINYSSWNPVDDAKTQRLLAHGDTIGVFYVESPAMRQLQKKTGKGDFEHLVIHSSIIRPAANEYISEYVRRLKGGSYTPLHPLLDDILGQTYGIMVYQEDVSKVAMALAGFSAVEADELRKVLSKKHKAKRLSDLKARFFAGAHSKGVEQECCERVWRMIASFSGYSFCKPHSASYALVSFKSAYLRSHFPAEFMAAVISNQGGYYSAFAYLSEARRMGLQVLMPDINDSDRVYRGCKKEIRIGLMQIKGLSECGLHQLLEERRKKGSFASFQDFLLRTILDPADVQRLILAGCFDRLEPECTRPELMWRLKWHQAHKQRGYAQTASLFESDAPASAVLPRSSEYDQQTLWQQEIETLGFLASVHPLQLYKKQMEKANVVCACDFHRHVGRTVRAIGWLITGKIVSTRKQELMEFMSFEDTTAIYETTFFPKAFSRFVHMISKTRPYLLTGRIQEDTGAVTLNVKEIAFLA